MNEYDSTVVGIVSAIFASRIINTYLLDKLSHETLSETIKDLRTINEDKLADAVSKKNHELIDKYSIETLIMFIGNLSKYLPKNVKQPLTWLYHCWFAYVTNNPNKQEENQRNFKIYN